MPSKNLPPHLPYDNSLIEKSRELRNNPTLAEKQFWYQLKEMEFFQEFSFNRQKPIGHYIVDFYCHQLQLVIEIDGDTHYGDDAEEYDMNRTAYLQSQNLEVIRFTNPDVTQNIDGVMIVLEKLIRKKKEEAP
jgi:very-short-patch-repair endonuclease